MRVEHFKKQSVLKGRKRRILAAFAALCLLLSQLNLGLMISHATDGAVFELGENVTAVLEDGVLTVSGMGDTEDFSRETAPFLDYSREIHTLVIEDGITYIGAYLFYGVEGLGGELILPESIMGFGDYAFSGDSLETAPGFSTIRNLFERGERTRRKEPSQAEQKPDAAPEEAAPSEAEQKPKSEEPAASESGREEAQPELTEKPTAEIGVLKPRFPQPVLAASMVFAARLGTGDMNPNTPEPENSAGNPADSVSPGSSNTGLPSAPENGTETERPAVPEEGTDSEKPTVPEAGTDTGKKPIVPEDGADSEKPAVPGEAADTEKPAVPESGTEAEKPTVPEAGTDPEKPAVPEDGTDTEKPGVTEDGTTELPEAETGAVEAENSFPDYIVETVTQQEITHPETLFYAGQSGFVLCADSNTTFLEAALSAGYQPADDTVLVTLDGTTELELPLVNGWVTLPACPEALRALREKDRFFTYKFLGWQETQPDGSDTVLAAGDFFEAGDAERIALYSVWETTAAYQLKTNVESTETSAVCTLTESGSGKTPEPPEGYAFIYQWQSATRGEEASVSWTDIDGAAKSIYRYKLSAMDGGMQLRCKVTAVRLARSAGGGTAVFYSEPVNAAAEVHTVFVSQTGGDDTNDGTESFPVQTLARAEALLQSAGGTSAEDSKIVLKDDYVMSEVKNGLFPTSYPVTISGATASIVLSAQGEEAQQAFGLSADLCLENLTAVRIQHIYGNGHDITIGNNVVNSRGDSTFYLYGGGNGSVGSRVGEITVMSGRVTRILGYIRSSTNIDAKNLPAVINVGGSAYVDSIMAGSASGGVSNGNVTVNVTGGKVVTLAGGNHGYQTTPAPYKGKTEINISGGIVTTILGAGVGRNQSIPTFCGTLSVNVSGGEVGDIYGAGSAAYVISPDGSPPSDVNIAVSGGSVGNIYAAGKGSETALSEPQKFTSLPKEFGSLSGNVSIMVSGDASVKNIYASGEGAADTRYDTTENAYLNGTATITLAEHAVVLENIYGGGKGIAAPGYESCARIMENSSVGVQILGGTVEGNVYGGGKTARTDGAASVLIAGGTVKGSVYGGGENGLVKGKTTVGISGGIVEGSMYGGAKGIAGERLVGRGATVNMTGGWIKGNLYGGSELSDDGPDSGGPADMIFVNLAGGTVSGNVFGGGYRGTVNGSTHLHIGVNAPNDCKYYQAHPDENPSLNAATLTVDGSVYAGGDYGGGATVDYDTITVTGTSHVYVDGTGYNTGSSGGGSGMNISGGVFGSGASCDAGSTRLVTIKNYGEAVRNDSGEITGVSRSLAAVQRADRVVLNRAHVKLTGQPDVANPNQTALYSLNRIGDHGVRDGMLDGENSLILQDGSTLILESAVIETANFKSVDAAGGNMTQSGLAAAPNTISFETGTVFRIACTGSDGSDVYGAVSGWAYLLAENTADAYAYARVKTDTVNQDDGGFADRDGTELSYTNVESDFRYWKISGDNASADRSTVLTAQTLKPGDSGYGSDGFSVASGTLELPPANAGVSYKILGINLPAGTGLVLADAAKNGVGETWVSSEINIGSAASQPVVESEQKTIKENPLSAFGLFMRIGSGFGGEETAKGKIISNATSMPTGLNSIINQDTAATTSGGNPHIDFYLTYYNDGITASKSLGTVEIVLSSSGDGAKTTLNVDIVTKASTLADQTVDLYATQSGSYTGKLLIPSGDSRKLRLTKIDKGSSSLVSNGTQLKEYMFSLDMLPEKGQGWSSAGLMSEKYDLGGGLAGDVLLGTTDSRYQAAVEFTLKNTPVFNAKDTPDKVILTLADDSGSAQITLTIHWKASVVSEVLTAPGRQYNGAAGQSDVSVSPDSAVTAMFTLSEGSSSNDLWLELRNAGSNKLPLPEGTQITILGMTKFYSCRVTGTEDGDKIPFVQFQEMWGSDKLTGTVPQRITVIVDFSTAAVKLSAGSYSLRLRSETGADSTGADFSVYDAGVSAGLTGGGGLSKGKHTFTVSVTRGNSTRWSEGMAAVLSPEDGELFPEGAVFRFGESKYYASGGKVYIPLGKTDSGEITMDTEFSAGLRAGNRTLSVRLFPTGWSSGAAGPAAASAVYDVAENPAYGIRVTLDGGSAKRVAAAGDGLSFRVDYAVENSGAGGQISVGVQRKGGNGSYTDAAGWNVQGNTGLVDGSGTQTIAVSVPSTVASGTYRLIFKIGDQKVPYNIIVN